MRILEIVLLLAVTIFPFVKRPLLKIINKKYQIGVLVVVWLLHIIFEGWRWQLFPAYLLMLILIWRIRSINNTNSLKLNLSRGLGYTGIFVLLIPAWILPNLLPVFTLPTPTFRLANRNYYLNKNHNDDDEISFFASFFLC